MKESFEDMNNTATQQRDFVVPADFVGKRVLVTGGTKGIGAAVARRFAGAGADVVVAARTPVDDPPAGRFVQADLATPEGVEALAVRALELLGGIDVLVDNAGSHSYFPDGALTITDEAWLRELDANLLSSVRLDRALLPSMVEQQSGVVVHVTSAEARLPQPASLAYGAAKAATTAYSKGLSGEMARHGIRVNAVEPGLIETPASTSQLEEMAPGAGGDPDAARQQLVDAIGVPLGRAGQPEDVAELVAFLASEGARYITGGRYAVDGGATPTI